MRFLDITLHTAHTLYSNEAHLMELLPNVDLLIGAVLVPGAKAPETDPPRNVAAHAARQRAGGYCDGPGWVRGNITAHDASRSRFR